MIELDEKKCPCCGHYLGGMAAHRTHWEEGYWSCHDDHETTKDHPYGEPCRCIIYFGSEFEKQLGLDKKREELKNWGKQKQGRN